MVAFKVVEAQAQEFRAWEVLSNGVGGLVAMSSNSAVKFTDEGGSFRRVKQQMVV